MLKRTYKNEILFQSPLDKTNVPLISYQSTSWTQDDFYSEVERAEQHIIKLDIPKSDFLLLNTQNPFLCYSYLFALIRNGYRVVLPSRDHFSQGEAVHFVKRELIPLEDAAKVQTIAAYSASKIPTCGNIVVFSSGSTGTPKGILHNFESFLANAKDVVSIVKKQNLTSLTYLKPYLVSALSHFLVHLISGSHLVFSDLTSETNLKTIVNRYQNLNIVGSPYHVGKSIAELPSKAVPDMFFCSGDMLSATTIKAALEKFPCTTFFYVYGLAELAGRFFINPITNGLTDFTVGSPLPSCEFRIENNHMFVRSPYLFKGYITNEGFRPSEEWHDSGDLAEIRENRIILKGRSNDEVKILGNKINLKYVENKIRNILASDNIVLIPYLDDRFGTLIGLVTTDSQFSKQSIRSALSGAIRPQEMPHHFFYTKEFPFTYTMKICRKTLSSEVQSLNVL